MKVTPLLKSKKDICDSLNLIITYFDPLVIKYLHGVLDVPIPLRIINDTTEHFTSNRDAWIFVKMEA